MYLVPLFKYYWHIFVIMQAFLCDEKPISYFAIILIWNSQPNFFYLQKDCTMLLLFVILALTSLSTANLTVCDKTSIGAIGKCVQIIYQGLRSMCDATYVRSMCAIQCVRFIVCSAKCAMQHVLYKVCNATCAIQCVLDINRLYAVLLCCKFSVLTKKQSC